MKIKTMIVPTITAMLLSMPVMAIAAPGDIDTPPANDDTTTIAPDPTPDPTPVAPTPDPAPVEPTPDPTPVEPIPVEPTPDPTPDPASVEPAPDPTPDPTPVEPVLPVESVPDPSPVKPVLVKPVPRARNVAKSKWNGRAYASVRNNNSVLARTGTVGNVAALLGLSLVGIGVALRSKKSGYTPRHKTQ